MMRMAKLLGLLRDCHAFSRWSDTSPPTEDRAIRLMLDTELLSSVAQQMMEGEAVEVNGKRIPVRLIATNVWPSGLAARLAKQVSQPVGLGSQKDRLW